jgi:toxin ParE1/3/4
LSLKPKKISQAIWSYVAADSGNEEIADRVIDSVSRRFDFLSNTPLGGRARDEVVPGLRSFPVGQYVIFYRVVPTGALILRVMHGRRDVASFFER